jgi:hypothetical protein
MRAYRPDLKTAAVIVPLSLLAGFYLAFAPMAASAQTTGSAQGLGGGTALNWAGYVSDGGTYTTVAGSWVVPTVTGTSGNGADATWIGIGGVSSHDLIQAGTEAVPDSSGGIDYQAWYELLPAGSVTVPLTVHAGDSITANITQGSGASGTWLITITDTTTGKSYSKTVRYTSSLSSAEWIEEMPAGVGIQVSLDNFGTVDFTGGSTTENGSNVSITGASAQPLTMATMDDEALAIPSAVGVDGGSFSVTRTDAASSSIGISRFGGTTFVTRGNGYDGYGDNGTTTSITPDINISYDYGQGGGYYYPRYRVSRAYSYSTDSGNGIISVIINNGFSNF